MALTSYQTRFTGEMPLEPLIYQPSCRLTPFTFIIGDFAVFARLGGGADLMGRFENLLRKGSFARPNDD